MTRHIVVGLGLLLAASVTSAGSAWAGGGEVWVSNEKDDTVSVIDVDTLEVTRTIEVGERPRGITFSNDHSIL